MAKRKKSKRNPGMPVVLVNPSKRRKKKRRAKRRANPRRPKRRRNPSRRRNPRAANLKRSAMAAGLGMLGGGVAYGLNYGVSQLPVEQIPQAAILLLGGGATSMALARYADERAAAGVAGGVAAMGIGRVRAILAARQAQEGAASSAEAGALYGRRAGPYQRQAGAVFRPREAGAILGKPNQGATRMATRAMSAPSFKEAGASRFVQGGQRWFGPQSWAARAGAGRVFVSAHNAR